jgi:hypothetical protein
MEDKYGYTANHLNNVNTRLDPIQSMDCVLIFLCYVDLCM